MDPEKHTFKDLLAVVAQQKAPYQRHKAVLSRQEELKAQHSDLPVGITEAVCELCCSSNTVFVEKFKLVFNNPFSGQEASKQLLTLNQGSRSTTEFAIAFQMLAAGRGLLPGRLVQTTYR